MFRRGTIASTTLPGRPSEAKAALTRQIESDVLAAMADGLVHVPLAAMYTSIRPRTPTAIVPRAASSAGSF
jgi:hypothetical protein